MLMLRPKPSDRSGWILGATLVAVLSAVLALAPAARAASQLPSNNVAWVAAVSDEAVDQALARAKAQRKPVLLYWGATWCPPCNQLKATLFNRQDFAAQAKNLVAVHIDGDRPGAQKLGARFHVRAYPTVILMSADGAEITRLPGEAEAPQILAAMQAGLAAGRPVKSILGDARSGKSLSTNEWRVLAFYSWETDEAQLVRPEERAALLAELASKSPAGDGETSLRLWLKALAASDSGNGLKPDAPLRARVERVLADPQLARTHMDVLVYGADSMVVALSDEDTPQRAAWVRQFDSVLSRLQNDRGLSRGDRVSALGGRIELARMGVPKAELKPPLPEALLREALDLTQRFDREISDSYERQSVITSAAYVLGQAGLWGESDRMLKSNLSRSQSPYYLMSQLGSNARKQGQRDEALRWYAQSFEKSVGPATRLQWGSAYLAALVDLAPGETTRIEGLAAQLLKEAAGDSGALYERSGRSLQRMGTQLQKWNAQGAHTAALQRLQKQLEALCAGVAAGQRPACERVLKGSAAPVAG